MLLVELDGALGHLPKEGELYGHSIKRSANTQENSSDATIEKLKEDYEFKDDETEMEIKAEIPAKKCRFQEDLDNPTIDIESKDYKLVETVQNWPDFLYTRYHPRTINIINDFKYEPDKQTFDTHSLGEQLWKTEQFEDEFCDKIRQYVEECDFMQGFQTIFDSFNGHGGLATQCMTYLNEEYGKANFAVPVYMPSNILYDKAGGEISNLIRVANSALVFQQLIEQASLFTPLCTQARVWRHLSQPRVFPQLEYQTENFYQTSAILASYLDTITLRYRLKNAPASNSLAGFCGDLTNYGRKMCNAALALPFPLSYNEDLIDCLDKYEGPLYTSLTPHADLATDYTIQSLCVRGIPLDRLKRPPQEAKLQMRMAAYKCSSVSEMFQLYLQCSQHASMSHVSSISSGMPIRIPYPQEIFRTALTAQGYQNSLATREEAQKVASVPVLANLQSSSKLADILEVLHREASRIKFAHLHRFQAAGLEEDNYSDALEQLLQFKDNYEDNFEL